MDKYLAQIQQQKIDWDGFNLGKDNTMVGTNKRRTNERTNKQTNERMVFGVFSGGGEGAGSEGEGTGMYGSVLGGGCDF